MADLTTATTPNPTDQINKLAEAQKQSTLAALEAKRQQALSDLTAEQSKLKPAYDAKRTDASVQSQFNKKNFAEFMQARGQNAPDAQNGTMNQAEISRVGSLQNALGGLNTSEADANNDIERRKSNVNNAYSTDIASANANIDAQTTDKLISLGQRNTELDRADANQLKSWDRADQSTLNSWNRQDAQNMAATQREDALNAEKAKVESAKTKKDDFNKFLTDSGYTINPNTGEIAKTIQGQLADNTINKTKTDAEAEAKKTTIDSEVKQYGIPLSDSARQYKDFYQQALQNTSLRKHINDALTSGDIRAYENKVVQEFGGTNDKELQDIITALEGARVNKIMSNPLTLAQYGGEYGMSSPKIAADALDYLTKQADSIIKTAQAGTANQVEAIKLEKAKTDLANGNIDNYIKTVEATFIEPEKKQALINIGLQGQNIVNTIENRNASTAQGNTSLAQGQQRIDNAKEQDDYNNLSDAISKYQSNPKLDILGKVIGYEMTPQGKENALNMIRDAAQKGISKDVINKLLTNFNLNGQ